MGFHEKIVIRYFFDIFREFKKQEWKKIAQEKLFY